MPAPADRGEPIAPSCGLGNADVVAVIGALAGPYFGVLLADIVGLELSRFASAVLIGLSAGFFAGSGRTISSMICSISASAAAVCSLRLEAFLRVP